MALTGRLIGRQSQLDGFAPNPWMTRLLCGSGWAHCTESYVRDQFVSTMFAWIRGPVPGLDVHESTTATDTSDTVFVGNTGSSGDYRNGTRSSDLLVTC
jgi:hypothetical protein